ncbi:MAG TPA: MaoC family dehydratase [Desulfosarcina sp.]|nr:MaoC family dehydratase [Desulfosarcina sp.]
MPSNVTIDAIKARVGREIGRSGWLRIDQARIDAFADCTEDHQWIHVDRARAAAGPFGATVAHGFLILALIPRLSRDVPFDPQGVIMNINYGLNRVRFIRPVPAGSEVRDTLVLKEVLDKGRGRILLTLQHTLHVRGLPDPVCVAETLRMCLTGSGEAA